MIDLKMNMTRDRVVTVTISMNGDTDALLDELAAGMATAIVRIADDLPAQDELHESLARVMASKMIDRVLSEMDLRARDKLPEA